MDSRESLMVVDPRDLLSRSWQSQVNLSSFLFLLILIVFVLPSVGFEADHLTLYIDIAFSIVLVVGAAIAWGDGKVFALTAFVCFVAIAVRWAAWWMPAQTLILASAVTGLAAVIAINAVLLERVLGAGPVTGMRIQGAIAVYLGLGLGWAHAYHIAQLVNPGSFITSGNELPGPAGWVNYSFGMLTTAGYSGITPLRPVAHALTSGESVAGPLYLTVLVARLVSMQVSAAGETPDEGETPSRSLG